MGHLTTKKEIRDLAKTVRELDTERVKKFQEGHITAAEVALERSSAALLIGIRLLDLMGIENAERNEIPCIEV